MKTSYYKLTGVLCTLLGAIGFSSKAILVKLVYRESPIDPISLLSLRMLCSLPFFLGMAYFNKRKSEQKPLQLKNWFYICIIGLMGYYVSSFLDFWGLAYISAGLERLILFTYPTIVVFLGLAINKKKISGPQTFALLLSYSGIGLAFAADIRISNSPDLLKGSLLVFACAFTYAIYVFSSGQVIAKAGTIRFTSVAMLAATCGILLHYLVSNKLRMHLVNYEPKVYYYSVLMAIGTTVLPSLFVSEGIRRIGSSNVAIISSIGPLATIFQASWFLNESFGWQQALGTVLVIAGVILLGRKLGKPQKEF